ncbi:helix-turn-helix domain-containing protein [Nocardioides cavernae]|uniref:Helix-turn-helix domain-containing protein n=1 Tax=Nocardioides cavernae TaxID=1921566 RepID=A0ABR8NG11_9ACTN|nr:IclR family transcriptional regulator C-terminal domain-containing protein [Nocardioides cavernae]MBD3926196.1 helix-turn-helix domain-containing protein [Nocardioides cavernae]MBM7513788.1 IclR family pca regulon transcriptional regulator [Nocardioides cavernae]
MDEVSERDIIQSIERGFAVLLAFDADLPRASLAELAEKTGLSRPAIRRILLTLQRLGYVDGAAGRWSLTPRVLTIGAHYAATHGVVEITQPHLLRIVELTGESASFAQLDGIDVVYVARVHARRVLSHNVDIGTRLPVHATSMGRVIAAFAPADVVDRIIDEGGLPALTPHTVTDPIAFRDVLHDVRHQGYALVDGELEEGFLSIAVPVRDSAGEVVGALAWSTSRGRHTPEDVIRDALPLLLEGAEAVSADLQVISARPRVLPGGPRPGMFPPPPGH